MESGQPGATRDGPSQPKQLDSQRPNRLSGPRAFWRRCGLGRAAKKPDIGSPLATMRAGKARGTAEPSRLRGKARP
jgi:hypothetical protein